MVEFFFVLSGFVMAHTYGFKNGLDFKSFFISRFFRIVPLHWFMFLVVLVLEVGKYLAFKYGGFVFNKVPFAGWTAPHEIIPNLLLIQAWSPWTEALSFNYQAWSISIEFYMYFIFFGTCVVFNRLKLFSCLLVSVLAFIMLYTGSDILREHVLRGLSCFFAGTLIYVLYNRTSKYLSEVGAKFFTLLEGLVLVAVYFVVSSDFENRSIIASLVFCITVFVFAFDRGALSVFLQKYVFRKCGELSYSIYMTHTAILFCMQSVIMIVEKVYSLPLTSMIGDTRYLTTGSPLVNNIVVLLVLVLVVYLSTLTYKYIECQGIAIGKKLKIATTKQPKLLQRNLI